MSSLCEDTPMGLAAAVRALNDPKVTVSGLSAAIAEGRLDATLNEKGKREVTLRSIREMLQGSVAKEEPVGDKREIKLKTKKRTGRSKS